MWLTRSLDPNIILNVEETEDAADRALAEWDEKHGGDKKKKGVSRYVVAFDADGEPLEYGGLTRQHFREERAQLGDREDGVGPGLEREGDQVYAVPPED